MKSRVPLRTVVQIVAVIAEEFVALLESLGRLHAQNPPESGVGEIRELCVGRERVVNFVSKTGAVLPEVSVLERNVQNLFLLLV